MEDFNKFIDETGKKLGLSDDSLVQAKEDLARKVREMTTQEDQRKSERQIQMDRQSRKIRHDMAIEQLKRQFACSHRKGTLALMPAYRTPGTGDEQIDTYNKFLPKLPPFRFDFAVIKHTFVDGKEMIKCIFCNRRWTTGDPDFDQANLMVQFSSNRPSASEQLINMPLPMMPQGAPAIAAVTHKGFWSRFIQALKDHFTSKTKVVEDVSTDHDKL